jgi:hypothetical protein
MQPTSRVATWKTCNQSANSNRAGQEALATNQRTTTALEVLATTQRSIDWLQNGLQLISDASTAIAWISEILQFEAICQRFLSRFRFDSSSSFVIFS